MKKIYCPETRPLANPANCICGDHYRITLLTDRLVRLEFSASGWMEDRPSQVVWNGDFPPVELTV